MNGAPWLAGITLVACVAALLHMALPPRHRRRVEAWWRACREGGRQAWRTLRQGRRPRATARREAEAAIRRAQAASARGEKPERPRTLH